MTALKPWSEWPARCWRMGVICVRASDAGSAGAVGGALVARLVCEAERCCHSGGGTIWQPPYSRIVGSTRRT